MIMFQEQVVSLKLLICAVGLDLINSYIHTDEDGVSLRNLPDRFSDD
jgi:hypothetical protein